MTGDSSEIKYPKSSLPKSSIKIPKYLYFVLMILALGIVIVVEINLLLVNKSKPNEVVLKPVSMTRLEMAKSVLNWMETEKNADGVYYVGCDYDKTIDKCLPGNIDNRLGLFALSARYQYYKKTKLPEDRNIINQDLKVFSNQDYILQTSTWSCRLMKDLWTEDVLSSEEKQMAKDICEKTDYEFMESDNIPKNNIAYTNDELIDSIIKSKPVEVENYNDNLLTKYLFYVTEFASNVNNNGWRPEDLESLFNRTLKMYISQKDEKNKNIFQLGTVAVDLYKVTKNNKYMDLAVFGQSNRKCLGMNECVFELILNKELYDVTKNEKYKQSFNDSLNFITYNYFDNKNFEGFKNGLGAFWTSIPIYADTPMDQNVKYGLMPNALLVEMLINNYE